MATPIKEKPLNKWCPHFKGYESQFPIKNEDLKCDDCIRHNDDCPYEDWKIRR